MNSNKTVVVTGASRGLGAEITRVLIENNFSVIGISRSKGAFEDNNFNQIPFDLSNLDQIPSLIKRIHELCPTIYGLVNNSAIGLSGVLATQHNSDIENILAVNLQAPILLSKYLSRDMLLSRQGRIVNVSSVVARTGYTGLSVYGASKGGLIAFSKSLARELGSYGITVNSVLPGFMSTEMTAEMSEDNLNRIRARSPLKSLPTVQNVAAITAHLFSAHGDSITGAEFVVDAGNSI